MSVLCELRTDWGGNATLTVRSVSAAGDALVEVQPVAGPAALMLIAADVQPPEAIH